MVDKRLINNSLSHSSDCLPSQRVGTVDPSSFFWGFTWVDFGLNLHTFSMMASLVAGTMFLVWLGELITERGLGNGISLIIFGGIVASFPPDGGERVS
ncbi:MAG: hypothetical protein CM1200mP3_07070 [Chloroflexota bacterium]|nr:MAG: hypothetical protein CM1200mP3_07070 [Chloroflexota bacterium]